MLNPPPDRRNWRRRKMHTAPWQPRLVSEVAGFASRYDEDETRWRSCSSRLMGQWYGRWIALHVTTEPRLYMLARSRCIYPPMGSSPCFPVNSLFTCSRIWMNRNLLNLFKG